MLVSRGEGVVRFVYNRVRHYKEIENIILNYGVTVHKKLII